MDRERSTYGESKGTSRVLVGKPEGRIYLEDRDVDGRKILKFTLQEWVVGR
jgi:hypothetical protein